MDLRPAAIRAAREPPHDRVVADSPAGRVIERRLDRIHGVLGDVEVGGEALDLARLDHPAVDPEQPVDLGPLLHHEHRAIGVGEREVALLREQQVEVELDR
jgi:hypothetical protein